MSQNTHQISDIKLEQYLIGELSIKEKSAIESELLINKQLQLRLEKIKESNQEIAQRYSAQWVVRQIEQKAQNATLKNYKKESDVRGSAVWTKIASACVMVALVSVLVFQNGETVNGIRTKGSDAYILLYKKTGIESVQLYDKTVAHKGDRIQIQYYSPKNRYGVIVSIDGNNTITTHFPVESAMAEALVSGKKEFLKYSYELDDAPTMERFYFITAESPFSVEELRSLLLESAQEGEHLKSLKISYDQFIITLIKEGY